MNRIKIGEVTESEKTDLLIKHERIIALKEVAATLVNNSIENVVRQKLENKSEIESPKAVEAFNLWWTSKAAKYGWMKQNNTNWSIDFNTNEIFIVPNTGCLSCNKE